MKQILLSLLLALMLLSGRESLASEHRILFGKLVKEGKSYYAVPADGSKRIAITDVFSKVSGKIDYIANDGKDWYLWLYTTPSMVQIRGIEKIKPKTPEEIEKDREASKSKKLDSDRQLAEEADKYVLKEGIINTPRGPMERQGNNLVQSFDYPIHGGLKFSGKDIVGRLAPKEPGVHYPVMPMENYIQVVRVKCSSAAEAAKASLRPFHLFEGAISAYTCRWDDNDKVCDLQNCLGSAKYGVHGTCFLNKAGMDMSGMNDLSAEDMKKIVASGSSIGNHAENHFGQMDMTTTNNQFFEVYRTRVVREAMGDCWINATAPPYNKFGDANSVVCWRQAGQYTFTLTSPGTNVSPKHNIVAWNDSDPLSFFSAFHARNLRSSASFEAAMKGWEAIGKNPLIWSPNWNQYGAYRYQYFHTGIERRVEGDTAVFTLYSPALVDLNDPIPLSFAVTGVGKLAVKSVQADDGKVEEKASLRARPDFKEYAFNLHHPSSQFLPVKIGLIEGDGTAKVGEDKDFPGLKGYYVYDVETQKARISLENKTGKAIEDLVVTYRFPAGWEQEVTRIRMKKIEPGAKISNELSCPAPKEYWRRLGIGYMGAQLDFLLGGEPSRLHLTNTFDLKQGFIPDHPIGNSVVCGPFKDEEAGEGGSKLAADFKAGKLATVSWKSLDAGSVGNVNFVRLRLPGAKAKYEDPEAKSDPQAAAKGEWYLLRTMIVSPEAQKVVFKIGANSGWLNGVEISHNKYVADNGAPRNETLPAELRRGENELLIAVAAQPSKIGTMSDYVEIPLDSDPPGALKKVTWHRP